MKQLRLIAVAASMACWAVFLAVIARWAGNAQWDAGLRIGALPYLAAAGTFALAFIVAVITSRQRLALCATFCVALASIIGAAWVGSASADRLLSVTSHDWAGIRGERYLRIRSLRVVSARGAVCLWYNMDLRSGMGLKHFTPSDRVFLDWARSPATGYPFCSATPPGTSVRPIPRVLGFDSCWMISTVPPTPGYWNQRDICAVTVPMWFLITLCMVVPAFWVRRWLRQRRRVRQNLCLACGYDLRSHNPADRCPECGTVVPPRRSARAKQSIRGLQMTYSCAFPSVWWVLLASTIGLGLVVVTMRRGRWLGLAAVVSVALAAAAAFEWRATWATNHGFDLTWDIQQADGRVRRRDIRLLVGHGQVNACAFVINVPRSMADGWLQHEGKSRRSLGFGAWPNRGRYPMWVDKYSVFKSEMLKKLGFQLCWYRGDPGPSSAPSSGGVYSITVPHYFVLLFCLPLPLLWLRRFSRRRKVRRWVREGRCATCGYILVAHRPGEKCPECATLIPPRPSAAALPASPASPRDAAAPG